MFVCIFVTIDIKDGCSLVCATHLLVKSQAECFHCNHFGVYIGHTHYVVKLLYHPLLN